jgi:CRP-like cAMP-binding protein/Fe-S-cluster-containing dehydrogenase component
MNTADKAPLVMDDCEVVVDKSVAELLHLPPVKLTIDDKPVEIPRTTLVVNPLTNKREPKPTTIYDAARQVGVDIPVLCHRDHMTPVAVCRFCAVDVKGARVFAAACHRQVEEGMDVHTAKMDSERGRRVRGAVKILTELLLADHSTPREAHKEYGDNELRTIAKNFGMNPQASRFPRSGKDRGHDESSVVIAVDHNACILCDRCTRGCNEIRNNQVLSRMGKGYTARISFDLNDPMGQSSCVACGECMISCPTGALTHRKTTGVDPWKYVTPKPEQVASEILYTHPLFEGVAKQFLGWNEGSVVRRQFKAGEIICREGEFGSTAFVIEKGKVEVFLQSPLKHTKGQATGGGLFGLVKRFTSTLVGRGEDTRNEESNGRYINVDAPVSLDYSNPIAELDESDLIFGEMTCMNNYPRAATVRAKTDVTVLEVLRNVLYILQRNKKSKEKLDKVYRRRAIDSQLRSVPIFAGLQADPQQFERFVEFFRERVGLLRLNPGEVVFRQGDPADAFYMVRVGFIKVSQRQPGGDHVLSYIGPGGYFGEIGLLADIPEIAAYAPAGVRTATCAALDHVDLVRITADDFHQIVVDFPSIADKIKHEAVKRLEQNEAARKNVENKPLGEFVKQGLMEAQSLLVLDLEKCTRCDECTKACADAHDGVTRLIREGLRFSNYLVASSCRSCLDPYCMVGCPVGSIRRRRSREIIIEDWCIGCGKCAENCPYGNINMHPFPTGKKAPDPENPARMLPVVQMKATTCDLCVSLDGQPSCVYACPHDAAHRMSGPDLIGKVEARMHR